MMKISMGIALPLFCESLTELVDIELLEPAEPEFIHSELQKNLPAGAEILSVKSIENSTPAIDRTVCWAEYKINILNPALYDFEKLVYNTEKVLSSDEILVTKKNKKGLEKTIDIRKSIGSHRFEDNSLFIVLKTGQGSDIPSLRADTLMGVIAEGVAFEVTRIKFLTESLHEL